MTTHISDNLTWTDEEEKITAQKVSDMIISPKSNVYKYKDGSCDVYDVTMENEKATIVNIKMDDEKGLGSWKIFAGKFEHQGIGPFVDNSGFDQNFNQGKGIRQALNNKIAVQQALKLHSQSMNR